MTIDENTTKLMAIILKSNLNNDQSYTKDVRYYNYFNLEHTYNLIQNQKQIVHYWIKCACIIWGNTYI